MGSSRYWEQPPDPHLAQVIAGWGFCEDAAEPPAVRVLPDGEVSLLFSAPVRGGPWEATLVGTTTRASIVRRREPRLQVQARLAPGAASLFGAKPRELRDRAVPLGELGGVWGGRARELLGALAGAGDWPERKRVIEAAFAQARSPAEPAAELVRRAMRHIRRDRGRSRIAHVCEALEAHPRQLERAFAHHLGVGPKLLARIVRFRWAREALRGRTPAAQVALSAGYSDQAHMTREFRAFAGLPPSLLGRDVGFVRAPAGVGG